MKISRVAVIIVHYGNPQDTIECVRSVGQLFTPDACQVKIIIVNNSRSKLDIDDPQAQILRSHRNAGFAGGNNIGLKWALKHGFDYFMLLNNDTIVDRKLLDGLLSVIKKDKGIGLVSPKIYFAAGYEFHHKRYKTNERGQVIWYAGGLIDWPNVLCSHRGVDEVDHGQFEKGQEADFATGCCLLIKKEVLDRVGLFDPRYFVYWEDVDLSVRVRKAGYKIYYEPKGKIWHKNAGSSRSGSELHDYYLTRNRLLFGTSYASFRTRIALYKEGIRLLFTGRKGQRYGSWDFFRGHYGSR